MKQILIIIIMPVMLLSSAFVFSSDLQPKIEIKDNYWDFGRVETGETVEHAFYVKNTGRADLAIGEIRPDCPCIRATISSRFIQPGNEAQLKVRYFTKGRSAGRETKSVLILSSDPDSTIKEVKLSITVVGEDRGEALRLKVKEKAPVFSSEQLHARLQNGEKIFILDVREENEYAVRHIPGAIFFPKSKFDKNDVALLGKLSTIDKKSLIVAYCGAGHRSGYVTRKLREMGFNAFNLDGITIWEKKFEVIKGPGSPAKQEPCTIRLEEAHDNYFILFDNVIWLDVRERVDYFKGHIKGAINIPLAELEENLNLLPRDKEIVVYCEGKDGDGGTCEAALSAGRVLLGHGYKQGMVKVFEDGYNAWEESNYEIETGEGNNE